MARSTLPPLCDVAEARGGYTVHPVPAPLSTAALDKSKYKAGGSSHRLRLLRRGRDMSGVVSIIGISQFPNLPIIIGMTRKKIMINA